MRTDYHPFSSSNETRLLTAKQAAKYLGIRPKTFWEWVNKGVIAQVRIPNAKPKYDIHDLDSLIEENKKYVESVHAREEVIAEIGR